MPLLTPEQTVELTFREDTKVVVPRTSGLEVLLSDEKLIPWLQLYRFWIRGVLTLLHPAISSGGGGLVSPDDLHLTSFTGAHRNLVARCREIGIPNLPPLADLKSLLWISIKLSADDSRFKAISLVSEKISQVREELASQLRFLDSRLPAQDRSPSQSSVADRRAREIGRVRDEVTRLEADLIVTKAYLLRLELADAQAIIPPVSERPPL